MKIFVFLVLLISNTDGREIYLLNNVKRQGRGLGSPFFFQPIKRQDAVDPALADIITVSIS